MKKAYTGRDATDAHLVRGLLEGNGIPAVVHGESLWGARGELPLTFDTSPSVWVPAEDYERARELIAEQQRGANPTHCPTCGYDLTGLPEPRCPECGEAFVRTRSWECPVCGETIEGQFTECWNCAAAGESP